MFGPQADLRSGQQGFLSQQETMPQQNQLGADREYAKQQSVLPPHSSFLPVSSAQPRPHPSQTCPVSEPQYMPAKRATDPYTDSSLSLSTTESLSQLPSIESRALGAKKSPPGSQEVTTNTFSHTTAGHFSRHEGHGVRPGLASLKSPPENELHSKPKARKELSPTSPESGRSSENVASKVLEEKSYEVTDEDRKRYLAFLNHPPSPPPEIEKRPLDGETTTSEQRDQVESSERGGDDSEEEAESPTLLQAMTFYDHSPGEVYTIHEDEEEASSPTAPDGVSRPRRKGRVAQTALPTYCSRPPHTRGLDRTQRGITCRLDDTLPGISVHSIASLDTLLWSFCTCHCPIVLVLYSQLCKTSRINRSVHLLY